MQQFVDVWEHIDQNSMLIGQSMSLDLRTLHISNRRAVFTAVLTADVVFVQGKKADSKMGTKGLVS